MRWLFLLLLYRTDALVSSRVPTSTTRRLVYRRAAINLPWQRKAGPATEELKASLVDTAERAVMKWPNGVGAPGDVKAEIELAATKLEAACLPGPARRDLSGVYELIYSTAPGGSNGKVGPFVGRVTQTFVDEVRFINAVELFGGAVKISLFAERQVLDGKRIRVTFKETGAELFGVKVFNKEINGNGVWVQRYVDEDLRVMNTPSLFILRRV
mmetsp:Transcript_49677/g.112811  ORF Transcript_49677/g.112811 Transcript_49677/m.112811 type:complete len:213 (+) Transcript_49677:102-740(+)